jgi:hypothetical protein
MLALLFALTPEAQACGMYIPETKALMAEVVIERGTFVSSGSLEDIFGRIDEEPASPAEVFERLAPPVDERAPELPDEAPQS